MRFFLSRCHCFSCRLFADAICPPPFIIFTFALPRALILRHAAAFDAATLLLCHAAFFALIAAAFRFSLPFVDAATPCHADACY